MRYEKPEVGQVANATYAIQGEQAKSILVTDSEPNAPHVTASAYEADE